jgi:photosystem II stability/assembly factor-like uncharacterized protein
MLHSPIAHRLIVGMVFLTTCSSLASQDAPATGTNPPADLAAAAPASPAPDAFAALAPKVEWRELGPANMGGRITDIDVHPSQPEVWYLATAGSGVMKTSNAGITWQSLFRNEGTSSIGDVAIAPSNPEVVWVGTGEENGRNSVSYGDGVYKSVDGGKTFAHMGLRETFQIGHVAIHPMDADIVFVAALGRLWGDNPDRGVFRTTDGGKTWRKVLYLDEKTGCIDVRIDHKDPNIVHACMYERRRDQFDSNDPAVRFGSKSGYFRSADGGDTWQRVSDGLPTCQWGRSAMTMHAGDSKILYMQVETERSGWANGHERFRGGEPSGNAYMGVQSENPNEGDGARLTAVTKDGPADKAGFRVGDVVTAIAGQAVEDNRELTRLIRTQNGGQKSKVAITRGDEKLEIEIEWGTREGGGEQEEDRLAGQYSGRLYGQRENVQRRQGDDGFETGGIFRSNDGGLHWERVNSLTDRPFYFSKIAVAPTDADTVWSCGIPVFKSTDGGKRFRQVQRSIHVDFHGLWIDPRDVDHVLVVGDGGIHQTHDGGRGWEQLDNFVVGQFYKVDIDTSEPYRVYGGLQDNGTWGGPSRSRWSEGVSTDEWDTIAGGDGFGAAVDRTDPSIVICTSQNGGMLRVDVARGGTRGVSKPRDAGPWNWDTPFFLSPHNQKVLYFAGRKVARSMDQGGSSESISPELGLTDRGTATAIAESPRVAGLLYVGTDDGALWRSRDGGKNWDAIHNQVTGLRGPRYVSSIHASHHEDGRVYVTFDGHRQDDETTYVFVSEDMGDSWRSLTDGLPRSQPCFCVIEDPVAEDLLFLGTEVGCWTSPDRGTSWHRFGRELPTVQVRDLVIAERDADLVAATHGRGIMAIDIRSLREAVGEARKADVHLFAPEVITKWRTRSRGVQGQREWFAPNPAGGATIALFCAKAPSDKATLEVRDLLGERVGSVEFEKVAGAQILEFSGRNLRPGSYGVVFTDGEVTRSVPLFVRPDPAPHTHPLSHPVPAASGQ